MALNSSGLKRLLSRYSTSQLSRCTAGRHRGTQRLHSNSSSADETMVKTYQKFLDIPEGGKISRRSFVEYGEKVKAEIEKIDIYEGFFVQAATMLVNDKCYGLTKFPEEGGKEYTPHELLQVLRGLPKDTVVYAAKIYARALFRAVDTNGDGYMSREDWSYCLKLQGCYESDEQATQAFDSIDLNKDGRLSMQDFENTSVKFWTSAGSNEDTGNMYGTQ